MAVSKEEGNILRSLGFASRGKNRFSKSNDIQTISLNQVDGFLQIEVDGQRIYGTKLSFNDVIKIITILFPNETRKRVRIADRENVSRP